VLGELALYDAPLDDLAAYMPHVEAVTPADVRAFAGAHMVDDLFIVLVGDAQRFAGAIADAHPDVTTIPMAQLDLSAT
jgi:zinc protease